MTVAIILITAYPRSGMQSISLVIRFKTSALLCAELKLSVAPIMGAAKLFLVKILLIVSSDPGGDYTGTYLYTRKEAPVFIGWLILKAILCINKQMLSS